MQSKEISKNNIESVIRTSLDDENSKSSEKTEKQYSKQEHYQFIETIENLEHKYSKILLLQEAMKRVSSYQEILLFRDAVEQTSVRFEYGFLERMEKLELSYKGVEFFENVHKFSFSSEDIANINGENYFKTQLEKMSLELFESAEKEKLKLEEKYLTKNELATNFLDSHSYDAIKKNRKIQKNEGELSKNEELEAQLNSIFEAISKLPSEEKPTEIFQKAISQAENYIGKLESPLLTLPTLKPKDMYVKGTDVLEHIENGILGGYLKFFTPSLDQDYLFRDQIKHLDENLYKALINQRVKIERRTNKLLSEIIPSKKSRSDIQIQKLLGNNAKEIQKTVWNAQKRKINPAN